MIKTRKYYCFLALAPILAGCASPAELRGGAPAFEQTIDGQPQKVAGCIGDQLEGWTGAGAALSVSSRPAEGGYSISATQAVGWGGNPDTVVLVDVKDAGPGRTRVQVFTHFLMGGEKAVGVVRKCL